MLILEVPPSCLSGGSSQATTCVIVAGSFRMRFIAILTHINYSGDYFQDIEYFLLDPLVLDFVCIFPPSFVIQALFLLIGFRLWSLLHSVGCMIKWSLRAVYLCVWLKNLLLLSTWSWPVKRLKFEHSSLLLVQLAICFYHLMSLIVYFFPVYQVVCWA